MSEHRVGPGPAMVPAVSRTAGTMFAALYGRLLPHSWRAPDSEHDAYQLFHQRSMALGWLDDRAAGGDPPDDRPPAAGLWGMNDAGWHHSIDAADTGLISWFQVEASAVAAGRPLPVQPFLRCAGDATTAAGRMELRALQVLLPVGGLVGAARSGHVPSMRTIHWFAERDPRARTAVEIVIDGGQDRSIMSAASQIGERIIRSEQEVFTCRSLSDAPSRTIDPPFTDELWAGPPRHRVTFNGQLVEWSLDALGWLAGFVADLAAGAGVGGPLLVTATKPADT